MSNYHLYFNILYLGFSLYNLILNNGCVYKKKPKTNQKSNNNKKENFLVVQWLGLHASNAGAWIQSLIRKLRYHRPRSEAKKKTKQTKRLCLTASSLNSWKLAVGSHKLVQARSGTTLESSYPEAPFLWNLLSKQVHLLIIIVLNNVLLKHATQQKHAHILHVQLNVLSQSKHIQVTNYHLDWDIDHYQPWKSLTYPLSCINPQK